MRLFQCVRLLTWAATCLLAASQIVCAQDKKAEDKSPKVILAVPLGIIAGKTNTVELRGLNLDTTKALRFTDTTVRATLASKGKADVPQNQKKERLGDTQVKAEVFVPADFKGDEAAFTIETPDGRYFLVVQDAHDAGSALHGYLVSLKWSAPTPVVPK